MRSEKFHYEKDIIILTIGRGEFYEENNKLDCHDFCCFITTNTRC